MTPAKRRPRKPHIQVRCKCLWYSSVRQMRPAWAWIDIVGANGEVILTGETMMPSNARRAARRLAKALNLKIIDRTKATKRGKRT